MTVNTIKKYLHLNLFFSLILLSACSSSTGLDFRADTPYLQRGVIEDLYNFPQDLRVYAKNSEHDLLSPAAQLEQDAKFNKTYFSPWTREKASYSAKSFRNSFGRAKGYKGIIAWTETEWQSIKYNADISRYPNTERAGIIVRQTSIRELPTMQPRYSEPTPNPAQKPFDYFQYASISPGTPVFISQISQDRLWYFVENPLAAGWVLAKDVAFVSPQFISNYTNHNMAALIKDKVQLNSLDGQNYGHAHIGAIFPIIDGDDDELTVLIPIKDAQNMAKTVQAKLAHNEAAKKPLPLQAKRIALVGNEMMGQPYGWGGTNEFRDCSATLHDLYTPFGIWLPRNSLSQYRSAQTLPLDNLQLAPKEQTILQKGIPFMTLIWLPGHIGLYLGEHNGRAAMFHNIWGIRVDEQGLDDDRHILGRAVVTSLEPGKELPNIYNNQTLLNRIGGISTLPGIK